VRRLSVAQGAGVTSVLLAALRFCRAGLLMSAGSKVPLCRRVAGSGVVREAESFIPCGGSGGSKNTAVSGTWLF